MIAVTIINSCHDLGFKIYMFVLFGLTGWGDLG